MLARASICAAFVILSCASGLAHADEATDDAQRYFKEGQALLESGHYAEACPKFEDSYKKDPQLGTLLNLAFCHQKEGRTWFAWLEFREAFDKASEAGQKDRAHFCESALAELERGLPRVVLHFPPGVSIDELRVDDRHVPDAENGDAFTAEVGVRKLTFVRAHKKSQTREVAVTKSASPQRVDVPAEWEDVVEKTAEPPKHDPPPVKTEPSDAKTRRTIAYGLFGGAALGIGVGAVFGVLTLGAKSDADAECPNKVCSADGYSKVSTGQTYGIVSTVGFIVGALAGGAGAYLFFSANQEPRNRIVWLTPTIGPQYAGASFGRTF